MFKVYFPIVLELIDEIDYLTLYLIGNASFLLSWILQLAIFQI